VNRRPISLTIGRACRHGKSVEHKMRGNDKASQTNVANRNIDDIKAEALAQLKGASDPEGIKSLTTRYLGRKGVLTGFLRNISALPPQERPTAGKEANQVKRLLEAEFDNALKRATAETRFSGERIDVSLPGRKRTPGALHPVTQISRRICEIFEKMGFDVAEGPEVESDYYNFEALNFPRPSGERHAGHVFRVRRHRAADAYVSSADPHHGKNNAAGAGGLSGKSLSL